MITTLSTLITDFFMTHLAKERNVSGHTVMAYRDTLKILLSFAAQFLSRTVDHLSFEHLSVEVILEFLNHLENVRRNTVRSRNARLAAIHSFFRYVLGREPALASLCQQVLTIPFKGPSGFSVGKRVIYNGSKEDWSHARYRTLPLPFGH